MTIMMVFSIFLSAILAVLGFIVACSMRTRLKIAQEAAERAAEDAEHWRETAMAYQGTAQKYIEGMAAQEKDISELELCLSRQQDALALEKQKLKNMTAQRDEVAAMVEKQQKAELVRQQELANILNYDGTETGQVELDG